MTAAVLFTVFTTRPRGAHPESKEGGGKTIKYSVDGDIVEALDRSKLRRRGL
jgi:hypothetical protein